jgi:hypothetical protein
MLAMFSLEDKTFYIPFVPVKEAIILGFARMSKIIGVSNQGI